MNTTTMAAQQTGPYNSKEDQTQLLIARLMEGGQEDDETTRDLDQLTTLLNDDFESAASNPRHSSICKVIDDDCVDTILGYLDMRQPELVRGHATLTVSAYLKAAGDAGAKSVSTFFFDRVRRGMYDDYIVAFCVAAAVFPIAPELISELFLSPGFIGTLGPLMRRKWKSRKVETACLEMLNAACSNTQCREAVEKYCVDWLEEVVDQDPNEVTRALVADTQISLEDGSVSMRRHSMQVQRLAAIILAKIRALPTKPSASDDNQPRIQLASTTIEELSSMFAGLLVDEEDHAKHHSIEGLAYASLQPAVKESLAHNTAFLVALMKSLKEAPPKSPLTYGALSILTNLTRYLPTLSEEEKKIAQLRAYANASGKLPGPDPLDDSAHVSERCKLVFDAGVTPILVTHSKNGSPASLSLIVSIINSVSLTSSLRGKLAQQGAVKLLLTAWPSLPEADVQGRRTAAQALARILISTNPALVFGGNGATTIGNAIRPLVSILPPDTSSDTRDLLPTFESLMALTNLASLNDAQTQRTILASAWTQIEDLVLSSNSLVSRASVELISNLVASPEGKALYADGSPQAKQRLHILLALADAEDERTRSAAGAALVALTELESVVKAVIQRERGISIILKMCVEDSEGLRHRAAFVLYNIIAAEGETGKLGKEAVVAENGVSILTECAKKCRQMEVLEVVLQVLKLLVEGNA